MSGNVRMEAVAASSVVCRPASMASCAIVPSKATRSIQAIAPRASLPARFRSTHKSTRSFKIGAVVAEVAAPSAGKRYETYIVLRPDLTEPEKTTFVERFEALLKENDAEEVEVYNRGTSLLAYTIKKANQAGEPKKYPDGNCILVTFACGPTVLTKFARSLQLDYDVLRFQTFTSKI